MLLHFIVSGIIPHLKIYEVLPLFQPASSLNNCHCLFGHEYQECQDENLQNMGQIFGTKFQQQQCNFKSTKSVVMGMVKEKVHHTCLA